LFVGAAVAGRSSLRHCCEVVGPASEHATERRTELRAHRAVDEEIGRIRQQNDEVYENTGASCRAFEQQNDVECVLNCQYSTIQYNGKGKGEGKCIAVCETSPHRYGKSLTIWDHTVLPATRQR